MEEGEAIMEPALRCSTSSFLPPSPSLMLWKSEADFLCSSSFSAIAMRSGVRSRAFFAAKSAATSRTRHCRTKQVSVDRRVLRSVYVMLLLPLPLPSCADVHDSRQMHLQIARMCKNESGHGHASCTRT